LAAFDTVTNGITKYTLQQRPCSKWLSKEEIKDAFHDGSWVCETNDVLESNIWYQRMYAFELSKELWRIILGEEEMVDCRSNSGRSWLAGSSSARH